MFRHFYLPNLADYVVKQCSKHVAGSYSVTRRTLDQLTQEIDQHRRAVKKIRRELHRMRCERRPDEGPNETETNMKMLLEKMTGHCKAIGSIFANY